MTSSGMLRRLLAWAAAACVPLAFAACSGGSGTPASPIYIPTASPATALVRAVHGSPDAGPVDIYVYAQGAARPTTPTVAGATYPQITNFLSLAAGTYTIDVLVAGAASTSAAVASETVALSGSTSYSVVVGGTVAAKTLRFVNFVEPAETAGQSALVVHHASPYVQNTLGGPVAVGVYDASQATIPATVASVFSFSLSAAISGPAASGTVSGGEFSVSPIPAGLPADLGFDAGPPSGTNLTTLVTSTLSGLATPLANQTTSQATLAADTTNAVPAGAHLSIFAVDTTTSAQLIGTLDP